MILQRKEPFKVVANHENKETDSKSSVQSTRKSHSLRVPLYYPCYLFISILFVAPPVVFLLSVY